MKWKYFYPSRLGFFMAGAVGGVFLCSPGCRSLAKSETVRSAPRVDHILLEVKDLDQSIKFYRDELGLTQKSRSGDFVILEAANVGVFLWTKHWEWSPPPPQGLRPPQGMYPHFVIA